MPLLQELLRQEPEHVAARYAYGICLTDTGRHGEAQVQFRRLLDDDPRHYEAAYRLGRLLQADADPQGAAEAYRKVLEAARQVLGVAEFRDTAARLRACQDTPGTTVPVSPPAPAGLPVTGRPITPGPPTLRAQSDTHHVADRGALRFSVKLKARHLLSVIAKRFLIAVALTLAGYVLAELGIGLGMRAYSLVPALVAWIYFLSSFVLLLVKPRTNGADFYEYGVDVKSGFIRRKVQFVWYYQIVESPSYVRTFGTYFTNTASLGLRYNEAGAYSTAYVEVPGIGTPNRVMEIVRYVESRAFPERYDVRKIMT
ncbi:tetratricopeptide repeat protein [Streptomyces asoensis]|uniref:Tetratricopeptide repeat protein n=1 Tax=Streptomyces asoensis TaxID=249586 RepID=A0A6M4WMF9_9ACTN|nr:tetratricopeptide repeat protein [Streptomyces asoensis]